MVYASVPELIDQESPDSFPEELIPRKKKIIDWLEKGRVYRSLADSYGPGILALIPSARGIGLSPTQ